MRWKIESCDWTSGVWVGITHDGKQVQIGAEKPPGRYLLQEEVWRIKLEL